MKFNSFRVNMVKAYKGARYKWKKKAQLSQMQWDQQIKNPHPMVEHVLLDRYTEQTVTQKNQPINTIFVHLPLPALTTHDSSS